MSALPIIRLELEGLRHQVVHALGIHNREVEESVAAVVGKAVEAFDFETTVRREVQTQLAEHIKRSVSVAMIELFSSRDVKAAIKEAVAKTLGVTP